MSEPSGEDAALSAVRELGLEHEVRRHGPVRSLTEAAAARGVEPADVVKTIVVRRGEGDYLFVLVPGNRAVAWPKLRSLLGVSRLSIRTRPPPSTSRATSAARSPRSAPGRPGPSSPTSASSGAGSAWAPARTASPSWWTPTAPWPP